MKTAYEHETGANEHKPEEISSAIAKGAFLQ